MNKHSYHDIPEKFKTREILMLCVQNNDTYLRFVHEDMMTYEMCMVAVNRMGNMLAFVPDKWWTEEICILAIKNRCSNSFYAHWLTYSHKMYEMIVGKYGYLLQYIPQNEITLIICKLAVSTDISALKFVPEKFIDDILHIIN
jgi:hypothetical protein